LRKGHTALVYLMQEGNIYALYSIPPIRPYPTGSPRTYLC
jgi:hypothetical protein